MRNPLFIEVSEKLRKRIYQEAQLHDGDWPLPTLNNIAKEYKTSLVTAQKAVEQLSLEGITYAKPGIGIRVNEEAVRKRGGLLNSFAIGLIFSDIFDTTRGIMGDIIKGISASKSKFGFDVKLISLPAGDNVEYQLSILKNSMKEKLDGIIVASRMPVRIIAYLQEQKQNIVWLNNSIPHEKIPAVMFDKIRILQRAAERLKELKIKKAAFIAPSASTEESRLFQNLCNNLKINELSIFTHGELKKESELQRTVRHDTATALSQTPQTEAIVCGGEIAAYAVLQEILSRGLRVPQDIRIISVAENEEFKQRFPVPADIIVHSFEKLAQAGAEMLHEILAGKFPEPHIKYIEGTLTEAVAK